MKKLVSGILIVCMLFLCCFSVLGAEGKTEIVFKVGDSTLMINGAAVTVEKPYVVGEGVTLVPIRVITEAFGAKVEWIAETKTVKLSYPDVEIVIQISNSVAEVNGKAEKLLAPPELSASGYTMIPLRFISENFGAEVSYDAATGGIKVIKELSEGGTVSIGGSAGSKYIGDSFYGWSMENPLNMNMEDRSFDGRETTFVDGDNEISVTVYSYDPEEYDFEKEYNEMKLSISDMTLVKADKNTDDANCKWMHFGLKDKSKYYDYHHFATPENVYVASGVFSNDDAKVRDEYLDILASFKCSFADGDIYDLSNVKDGFRRFESKELKFSFDVPDNFYMQSSEEAGNRFMFAENKDEVDYISAVIYSKSDVKSAKDLATEDYNHNKTVLNETMTNFSEGITERQYNAMLAYEYTYTVEAYDKKEYTRDVFFEVGDYVYNMAVTVKLSAENKDEYIDRIINSIKAEPLNSNDVGVLMKNMPVATGTFGVTVGDATVKLPNIYTEVVKSDEAAMYIGAVNGIAMSIMELKQYSTLSEIKKVMEEIESDTKEEFGSSIIKTTTPITMRTMHGFSLKFYSIKDESAGYTEEYAFINDDVAYVLIFTCADYSYSESAKKEIKAILDSLVFD